MMLDSYSERVEKEGGEFAQAYANALVLIRKGPKPEEGSLELVIAEAMHGAVNELRSADSEFYSAHEKAMNDLNKHDGSKPSELLNSHGFRFAFTHGWGAQLDAASAAYDSAMRHFWSVYFAGIKLGLWADTTAKAEA